MGVVRQIGTFQVIASTLQELVEDMETPLSLTTYNDSALLQEVPVNSRTSDATVRRKADLDKLSETTGIVIPLRLSVTERFENRVSLEDLIFNDPETVL